MQETQEIEQLINDIGDDTNLLYEKIKDYFQKEDFTGSEKILIKYLEVNQQDSMAFRLRAECRLKLGKYIQALHDMEQAMLLDPSMECCKSSEEHYQIKKGLMRMSNDI